MKLRTLTEMYRDGVADGFMTGYKTAELLNKRRAHGESDNGK